MAFYKIQGKNANSLIKSAKIASLTFDLFITLTGDFFFNYIYEKAPLFVLFSSFTVLLSSILTCSII